MASIDLGGASLRYELSGRGEETVILLNGIAMSIGNWRPVVDGLSPDYRVLCHDFRGQMLSSAKSGPYSLRGHAEDLAALMRSLGIDVAHIVGTSYGSEVALEFALTHPEMTRSLVPIAAVSYADAMLRAAVEGWKAAALADPVVFWRSILAWNYSAEFIEARTEDLAKREKAVASLPRAWFEDFAALCDAFLAIDLRGRLASIRVPTLVIHAEKDILKGGHYARSIAEEIPGSEIAMVPGSGHAAVMERPETVLALLRDFLPRPGPRRE
jgi:3-oxoadipate enol-lactonase